MWFRNLAVNRHFYQLGKNAGIIREGAKRDFCQGHFSCRRAANSDACDSQWSFISFMQHLRVITYLQTGQRLHCITRRLVVTCYNSAKPPETSECVHKRPKTHSFSGGRASSNGIYNWDNAECQLERLYNVFSSKNRMTPVGIMVCAVEKYIIRTWQWRTVIWLRKKFQLFLDFGLAKGRKRDRKKLLGSSSNGWSRLHLLWQIVISITLHFTITDTVTLLCP